MTTTTRCICLEDIKGDDDNKMTLKCNHVFHTKCVGEWIIAHGTCPFCRHHDGHARTEDDETRHATRGEAIDHSIEVFTMWMKQIIIAHFISATAFVVSAFLSPDDLVMVFVVDAFCMSSGVFAMVLGFYCYVMIELCIASYAASFYRECYMYMWRLRVWLGTTIVAVTFACLAAFPWWSLLAIVIFGDIYILSAERVFNRFVHTQITYTQLIIT